MNRNEASKHKIIGGIFTSKKEARESAREHIGDLNEVEILEHEPRRPSIVGSIERVSWRLKRFKP